VIKLNGENGWMEIEPADNVGILGNVAYLKDGNIAFKCGSPSQCSQCGRCGSPKDVRAD
jgi:hypothetical protein